VNSARIKNDFLERVLESRCQLETGLRDRMPELTASAEQALERARHARAEGRAAVEAKLASIARLRSQVARLGLQGGE